MNYRGCMVLLASVLLSGGCVGSRPAAEVATEAKNPVDELYLKGIALFFCGRYIREQRISLICQTCNCRKVSAGSFGLAGETARP